MDGRTAPATRARQQMVDWLLGQEAVIAARAELRRFGLDAYEPSDLLNDVVVKVLQADFDVEVANPVAYARRSMTNRARDLLSAERVRRRHHASPPRPSDDDDDLHDRVSEIADVGALDPEAAAALRDTEDEVRRRLHLALAHTRTWVVAAAMATVTLRLHVEVARPEGAPTPAAGSDGQADRWAALWLSGQTMLFADPAQGRSETPAMRKARSRRLQEVEAMLLAVAGDVLPHGGSADG